MTIATTWLLFDVPLSKQCATQQIARNLLAIGMDPAQIAAVTELTLEQVQQLDP